MRALSRSVLIATLAGCGNSSPNGVVELRLVDGAPARTTTGRSVTVTGVDGLVAGRGWVPLTRAAQTFDLSLLRSGAFQVLGRARLEPGRLQTLRVHIERTAPAGAPGLGTANEHEPSEVDSDVEVDVELGHCSHGDIELELDEDSAKDGHRPVAHLHHVALNEKCDAECDGHDSSCPGTPPPASCTGVVCPTGQLCQSGACVPDPCLTLVCPTGQVCQSGACVPDPCSTLVCPIGHTCSGGVCL